MITLTAIPCKPVKKSSFLMDADKNKKKVVKRTMRFLCAISVSVRPNTNITSPIIPIDLSKLFMIFLSINNRLVSSFKYN